MSNETKLSLKQLCDLFNAQEEWNPNNEQMCIDNGYISLCHIDDYVCASETECIAVFPTGDLYVIPLPEWLKDEVAEKPIADQTTETVSTENSAPTYVPISAEEARQVRSKIQDMGKLYDWIRTKSKITTDQFVHSQCLLNEAQIEELRNLGYTVKQPLPTSNYHEISW